MADVSTDLTGGSPYHLRHAADIHRNFPSYKQVAVADLVPYASNARTHSDAQIAQIAAAIREWGWTNPVLVDEQNGLIAGHGRLLAARKLGMADVPAILLEGLTGAQKRALVLADNKIALNAGWDDDTLRLELTDLKGCDFDLGLLGFGEDELGVLFADMNLGLTDPDDMPDLQAETVSITGDVWLLGQHRLVCGDSTDPVSVDKVLAGVKPHLMVSDPPYGVEYDASWRNRALASGYAVGGARAIGRVENDNRADWSEAWALFPGDVVYVWHAGNMAHIVAESLLQSGFDIRAQIIWVKNQFVIGRGHYHPGHEPCWYAVRAKAGATGHWHGDRKQSTVWQIDKPRKSETGHSTQKPIECMKRPIENNSSPGQAVYEPFSGSGTTLIACEMTGRSCHAIEISPAYVDVAVRRWEAFAGASATLEGDGRTFADVEASR